MATNQVRALQRSAVDLYLHAARLPLTAYERLARKGRANEEWPPAVAFAGFEAAVKSFVGSILRDDELAGKGSLEQARVSQLRKAAELDTLAEQRRNEADTELQQRRERDEQQRQRIEKQAEERRRKVEQERKQQKQQVAKKTAEGKQQAAKTDAAVRQALTKQERSARSVAVQAESKALTARRQALQSTSSVASLDDAIEGSKETRSNS
ncbi:MAG: hypothetical protein M3Z02_12000 [Actinomycetota bacterium]|nr:hypothetical protein [Actinomycetota bacterium]